MPKCLRFRKGLSHRPLIVYNFPLLPCKEIFMTDNIKDPNDSVELNRLEHQLTAPYDITSNTPKTDYWNKTVPSNTNATVITYESPNYAKNGFTSLSRLEEEVFATKTITLVTPTTQAEFEQTGGTFDKYLSEIDKKLNSYHSGNPIFEKMANTSIEFLTGFLLSHSITPMLISGVTSSMDVKLIEKPNSNTVGPRENQGRLIRHFAGNQYVRPIIGGSYETDIRYANLLSVATAYTIDPDLFRIFSTLEGLVLNYFMQNHLRTAMLRLTAAITLMEKANSLKQLKDTNSFQEFIINMVVAQYKHQNPGAAAVIGKTSRGRQSIILDMNSNPAQLVDYTIDQMDITLNVNELEFARIAINHFLSSPQYTLVLKQVTELMRQFVVVEDLNELNNSYFVHHFFSGHKRLPYNLSFVPFVSNASRARINEVLYTFSRLLETIQRSVYIPFETTSTTTNHSDHDDIMFNASKSILNLVSVASTLFLNTTALVDAFDANRQHKNLYSTAGSQGRQYTNTPLLYPAWNSITRLYPFIENTNSLLVPLTIHLGPIIQTQNFYFAPMYYTQRISDIITKLQSASAASALPIVTALRSKLRNDSLLSQYADIIKEVASIDNQINIINGHISQVRKYISNKQGNAYYRIGNEQRTAYFWDTELTKDLATYQQKKSAYSFLSTVSLPIAQLIISVPDPQQVFADPNTIAKINSAASDYVRQQLPLQLKVSDELLSVGVVDARRDATKITPAAFATEQQDRYLSYLNEELISHQNYAFMTIVNVIKSHLDTSNLLQTFKALSNIHSSILSKLQQEYQHDASLAGVLDSENDMIAAKAEVRMITMARRRMAIQRALLAFLKPLRNRRVLDGASLLNLCHGQVGLLKDAIEFNEDNVNYYAKNMFKPYLQGYVSFPVFSLAFANLFAFINKYALDIVVTADPCYACTSSLLLTAGSRKGHFDINQPQVSAVTQNVLRIGDLSVLPDSVDMSTVNTHTMKIQADRNTSNYEYKITDLELGHIPSVSISRETSTQIISMYPSTSFVHLPLVYNKAFDDSDPTPLPIKLVPYIMFGDRAPLKADQIQLFSTNSTPFTVLIDQTIAGNDITCPAVYYSVAYDVFTAEDKIPSTFQIKEHQIKVKNTNQCSIRSGIAYDHALLEAADSNTYDVSYISPNDDYADELSFKTRLMQLQPVIFNTVYDHLNRVNMLEIADTLAANFTSTPDLQSLLMKNRIINRSTENHVCVTSSHNSITSTTIKVAYTSFNAPKGKTVDDKAATNSLQSKGSLNSSDLEIITSANDKSKSCDAKAQTPVSADDPLKPVIKDPKQEQTFDQALLDAKGKSVLSITSLTDLANECKQASLNTTVGEAPLKIRRIKNPKNNT